MAQSAANFDGVAVVKPVTVEYQRTSHHGAQWFAGTALARLLRNIRIPKTDVDGLAMSSMTMGPDTAVAMTSYLGLSPRWLEHIPMGGASGVVALRRAARAIQAGDAKVVACIAADTNQPGAFKDLVANFSTFSMDAVYPYGAAGPNAVFAMITRHYMDEFGATREDFARLCMAQRQNAARSPLALLRQPMTLDDYMTARPVAEPLHLFDCVMPCAGAEAFFVMSTDRAKSLGVSHVTIRAVVERHNAYPDDPVPTRGGWAMERERLYNEAGLGPEDMDFVETYDDYPVISLMQLEDLGFCAKGEGPAFLRNTDLTVAGDLPHNTCGGQLSMGQAGAAGGYLGLVEAIRQLTGQANGDAVEGARFGLVSGYGMAIYDRCLCTGAAILERASS